ncbi:MAG: enolase C-terminal domain-like protein [Cytophagales bacterium]|nr:enolase C-terminal domain-like protein [Cytophagales bacterium]
MLHWTIEKVSLHLKYAWTISRGTSNTKTNFYIKVSDANYTGMGEVAPNLRYNETPEKTLSEFAKLLENGLPLAKKYEDIINLLQSYQITQSLRCGIECAYISYYCKKNNTNLHKYLSTKVVKEVNTSFSVPLMNVSEMHKFFLTHNLYRFKYIKLKVDEEHALSILKEAHNITDQPIIVDANEGFTTGESFYKFMDAVQNINIEFIEQPFAQHMDEEYYFIKQNCPFAIFADESAMHNPDFVKIKRQFDGINFKIMKSGGLMQTMRMIKEAKLFGMKIMIGCMVESTLAISLAMHLASEADYIDLDSFMYIDNDTTSYVKEYNGIITLLNS